MSSVLLKKFRLMTRSWSMQPLSLTITVALALTDARWFPFADPCISA